MLRFTNYKQKILPFDLISKFNYLHPLKIPTIDKINLSLSDTELLLDKTKICNYLFLLEQLTNQKSTISISKKNKIKFKIKKGSIIGCYLELSKLNIDLFFELILLLMIHREKYFMGYKFSINDKNILNFLIKDWFPEELSINSFFSKTNLKVTLKIKSETLGESQVLLNSFNFPIINLKKNK